MATKTGMERMMETIEAARKRRARALRLRESGMTIQEVGNSLGVTKQRAAELISRARLEAGK